MKTYRPAVWIGLLLAICILAIIVRQRRTDSGGQAVLAQAPIVPPAPPPPGIVPPGPPPLGIVPPAPPPPVAPEPVPPLVDPNGPPPVAPVVAPNPPPVISNGPPPLAPGSVPPVAPLSPSVPLTASQGDVQLSGLYVQQRTIYGYKFSSLEYHHYYFFPTGQIFIGLPPGGTVGAEPRVENFAAMQKIAPDQCGTYLIRGDRITIEQPGKAAQTMSFAFERAGDPNTVKLDTVGTVKVGRFNEQQRLSAVYEAGATARTDPSATRGPQQSFLASSTTLNFRPDGTFSRDRLGLIDADGKEVGLSGDSSQGTGGTYQLSGNTLTMVENGQARSATVYPRPDEQEFPPNHMLIDGSWYKLSTATN